MPKISETDLLLNADGSVYHLNLLPKHISDTIIAVGDPSRVYLVSQFFDDIDFEMNKREFITHVGKFNGKKITVISLHRSLHYGCMSSALEKNPCVKLQSSSMAFGSCQSLMSITRFRVGQDKPRP